MADGTTVKCLKCGMKRLIRLGEMQTLSGVPLCDDCYMPMVAVEAKVTLKKSEKQK